MLTQMMDTKMRISIALAVFHHPVKHLNKNHVLHVHNQSGIGAVADLVRLFVLWIYTAVNLKKEGQMAGN